MTAPFTFDPFDPNQTQNMWGRFREIRENQPVSRPGDFVFVSRYQDALKVIRKPKVFGNRQGFRAPGIDVPLEDRLVGELDPPVHQPVRRLLTSIMVPATVDRVRPFAERMAHEGLTALAADRGGDLVARFTQLLPTQITIEVLGLPAADSGKIAAWANELLHSEWPATNRTERGVGLSGAFPEYAGYIDEHICARRSSPNPPDDLMAQLIAKQVFEKPISDRQTRALVSNLLLGGISTSTSMLGNLLHQLLTCREDFEILRSRPDLIPAAVEESLRVTPPVLYVVRNCERDTEIGGVLIREGERVIVSIASANRDHEVFPDADEFKLDREDPLPHLSFSGGPHLCLGAGLARMTGSVVLREFVKLFDPQQVRLARDFRFACTPVFLEYGPRHLPVLIHG